MEASSIRSRDRPNTAKDQSGSKRDRISLLRSNTLNIGVQTIKPSDRTVQVTRPQRLADVSELRGNVQDEQPSGRCASPIGSLNWDEEVNYRPWTSYMDGASESSPACENPSLDLKLDNLDRAQLAVDSPEEEGLLPSRDFDELMQPVEFTVETGPAFSQDKVIDELQQVALQTGLDDVSIYLEEFENKVQQEILMIGSLSYEDIIKEEQAIRGQHVQYLQKTARVRQKQLLELRLAMERARSYVLQKYEEKKRKMADHEKVLSLKNRLYQHELQKMFHKAEQGLQFALKKRKAEIKSMYGDLSVTDGIYGGVHGKRWKIDWEYCPQPVQIKLRCLRGIKDKLPTGSYVVMVSMYNRLGGQCLRWSNLRGLQWGGVTLPVPHEGNFYGIETKIDQSVFTVLPSKPDIKPTMVLVMELFLLRGPSSQTDRVVGWSCFPICDVGFNIIEGKFKTPFLHGAVNPNVHKYGTIQALLLADPLNYLCNLYFEITKLPRYTAGQKEYEVELQFTSSLLSHPPRASSDVVSELRSEPRETPSRQERVKTPNALVTFVSSNAALSTYTPDIVETRGVESRIRKTTRNLLTSSPMLDTQHGTDTVRSITPRLETHSHGLSPGVTTGTRRLTAASSTSVIPEPTSSTNAGGNTDSDLSDDEPLGEYHESEFRPLKGRPGIYYRKHASHPSEIHFRKACSLIPRTPLIKQLAYGGEPVSDNLEQYSFSVRSTSCTKSRFSQHAQEKARYIWRMGLAELGLSQVYNHEFWISLVMLLVTWWTRMCLHYLAQWILLMVLKVPINKLEIFPYTVTLNYQDSLLRSVEVIELALIGPLANLVLFLAVVMLIWLLHKWFRHLPLFLSKLVLAFGINTFLNCPMILIVDCALQRYQFSGTDQPVGDAFKLYWHFIRYYNNTSVTVFISTALMLFVYTVLMLASGTLLYIYFLLLHNDGRVMDTYWRLAVQLGGFFIPHDLEVSSEELVFVCQKAEQWRGEEGERRKTVVCDYIWRDDEGVAEAGSQRPSWVGCSEQETTTHLAIYTVHLDGMKELYRHFLRLPDGAIIELFGDLDMCGLDIRVKTELISRTKPSIVLSVPDPQLTDEEGQLAMSLPDLSVAHQEHDENVSPEVTDAITFLGGGDRKVTLTGPV